MKNIDVYEVPEAPGIFIDSAVIDPFNQLVFTSIWGHTAAIQTTIAQITVGDLPIMTIHGEQVTVTKEMIKKVGKLPANSDYGKMTHALIYRKTAVCEQAGRRELLFHGEPPEKLIFQAVQSISVLPLMDCWLDDLLKTLRDNEMLIDLNTVCGNVHGIHINLGNEEAFGHLLSQRIKSGQLLVDGG